MYFGEEAFSEFRTIADELFRAFIKDVLPRLEAISDESKRYLLFLGWLNKELINRNIGRIVLTGGFAVEVYTGRIYRTMDVDVIIEGEKAREVVELFLEKFSDLIGRGYLPKYEIIQLKSIDIVSTIYGKSAEPTIIRINEYYVYVEPVEELIITYLSNWKYWDSSEDRDKALWLYIVWRNKFNYEYLVKRAREENISDYLDELERIVKANISV